MQKESKRNTLNAKNKTNKQTKITTANNYVHGDKES